MPMTAYTTDFDPEAYAGTEVGARDWKGDPVASVDQDAWITTSLGGGYDSIRMGLQYKVGELAELEIRNVPKTERVNEDRACMQAADEALNFMQQKIKEVPQPKWVNDSAAFGKNMAAIFNQAAAEHQIPQSKMDNALATYDLRPASKNDVAGKIQAVESQIRQMDQLVQNIDEKFSIIEKTAISPDDKLNLSRMLGLGSGVTHSSMSIDAIYAVDPGRFKPQGKDHYDPRNLIDVLQAVDHFLENPARGLAEGMSLYGPNAIKELREALSDALKKPEPGMRGPEGVLAADPNGAFAPPRNSDNGDPYDPTNPNNRRKAPGFALGAPGT